MDDEFSRSQWSETANDMGVPLNTADSWLRRLVKSGVVVKGEERGIYKILLYIICTYVPMWKSYATASLQVCKFLGSTDFVRG